MTNYIQSDIIEAEREVNKMKETTIKKIKENRIYRGQRTVIGQYTYDLSEEGKIIRCLTSNIGRTWLDQNGKQYDDWKTIND